MKRIAFCALVIAAVSAPPAAAGDNGFFFGGSLGVASLDIRQIDDDLGEVDFRDSGTAYKLFAGYRFLGFFGVEAGYRNLGTPNDTVGTDRIDVEIALKGWDAAAVGYLPVGAIDLFAKVGVIGWNADIKAVLDSIPDTGSDSGTDLEYGIGLALHLGPLAVRGELERLDIDGADEVYMVSAGVTFSF